MGLDGDAAGAVARTAIDYEVTVGILAADNEATAAFFKYPLEIRQHKNTAKTWVDYEPPVARTGRHGCWCNGRGHTM